MVLENSGNTIMEQKWSIRGPLKELQTLLNYILGETHLLYSLTIHQFVYNQSNPGDINPHQWLVGK